MRIHSKFKDYYDSARAAFFGDAEPVYVRETSSFEAPNWGDRSQELRERIAPWFPLLRHMFPQPPEGAAGVVGFCGRAYPFYEVWEPEAKAATYCFTLEAYADAVRPRDRDLARLVLMNPATEDAQALGRKVWPRFPRGFLNLRTWESWHENRSFIIGDDLFRAVRAPVVAYLPNRGGADVFIVNPRLKEFGFAKVMSPYAAFQELSMFVGNNLAFQDDPMSRMTDVDKRDAHGFDGRSFKRDPTKNRAFKRKGR